MQTAYYHNNQNNLTELPDDIIKIIQHVAPFFLKLHYETEILSFDVIYWGNCIASENTLKNVKF